MAINSRTVGEPAEGERRESECHAPTVAIRRRERVNPGNLKGKSLAVILEQKIGPIDHEDERPFV